ncbi:putative integral membrane protein [Microbacterium sp. HM58-2]|nr:putative integral membrane protein [Microbacterium sp. HM58-2]
MTVTTPRPRWLSFVLGVGGGALGLLPWLVGGGRMPLQNLWVVEVLPESMPFVLLPLSQYSAVLLFSLVLIGGIFGGLAVHVAGRRGGIAAWPGALGVLLVHVIAVVQSFGVLHGGLGLSGGGDTRAVLYFAGMLGGTFVAALLAQLAFWMTSRRSAGVASLGVALAAVPFANWAMRWVVAFTGEALVPIWTTSVARWIPAVVVGLALVWCGVRPLWRLVVWVVALLALWIVPALYTAFSYGLGMRVLDGDVVEMMRAAAQVFPMALGIEWLPVVVAAGIGVVGTVGRMLVGRGRRDEPRSS